MAPSCPFYREEGAIMIPWDLGSLSGLFFTQVRMRSRNRIGSFFARSILDINGVLIAAGLTITEDEPV
jgi:hypothetical protein